MLLEYGYLLEGHLPEDIGPLYSTAFLLERERRPEEAIDAWRQIIAWSEERGLSREAE